MEKILRTVLSNILLKKYPRIKRIEPIQFSNEYYRIVYYMNRTPSKKLEKEITEETMNILKSMGVDDNDFGFEFF